MGTNIQLNIILCIIILALALSTLYESCKGYVCPADIGYCDLQDHELVFASRAKEDSMASQLDRGSSLVVRFKRQKKRSAIITSADKLLRVSIPFSYKSCFGVLNNQDTKATLKQQCYTQLM